MNFRCARTYHCGARRNHEYEVRHAGARVGKWVRRHLIWSTNDSGILALLRLGSSLQRNAETADRIYGAQLRILRARRNRRARSASCSGLNAGNWVMCHRSSERERSEANMAKLALSSRDYASPPERGKSFRIAMLVGRQRRGSAHWHFARHWFAGISKRGLAWPLRSTVYRVSPKWLLRNTDNSCQRSCRSAPKFILVHESHRSRFCRPLEHESITKFLPRS